MNTEILLDESKREIDVQLLRAAWSAGLNIGVTLRSAVKSANSDRFDNFDDIYYNELLSVKLAALDYCESVLSHSGIHPDAFDDAVFTGLAFAFLQGCKK